MRRDPFRSILRHPADADTVDAISSGADVILVEPEAVEPLAGSMAKATAKGSTRPLLFARIRAFDSGQTEADLDQVVQQALDGVFLPRATGGGDIMKLSAMLAAREALAGLHDGRIRIIASATGTAESLLALGGYRGTSARLIGLAWNAQVFGDAIGAKSALDSHGALTDPSRLARSLCLIAAAAANVAAIDQAFGPADNGLEADVAIAARDGFTAKIAAHPDQVVVINRVFAESARSAKR